MLADSKLPTTFWVKAVNTACYVQNRVLVIKPHNKTPYELFLGRKPALNFMRPFGCPITILNTLDHLGMFDGKSDDGFFVGHSINSKAFRLPFLTSESQNPKSSKDEIIDDDGKKNEVEDPAKEDDINGRAKDQRNNGSTLVNVTTPSNVDYPTDPLMPDLEDTDDLQDTGIFCNAYDDEDVGAEADLNNLETTMSVSPIPTTRIYKDHPKEQIIGDINSATQTRRMIKMSEEHAMISYINKQRRTNHKDYQNCLFACFLSQIEPKKVIQALADSSWVEAMQEELLQFRLQKFWRLVDLPKGKHALEQNGSIETKRMREEYYNQVDKALYGLHQAPRAWYETLSTYLIGNGFRRGTIDKTLFIKKDKGDILLVQMSSIGELTFFLGLQVKQKDNGIFISQDKYVADILKKFDFSSVKTASTPLETNKALIKDEEAEDVDVHLYRSMIGSLMYLTASRPDIMFAVCACARFQVTPKTSHLHAVKRIFRYLKGQPKLGLWYPRDSPFDLEAFLDSDYAGASLDRKSITGAEYVAAANCCGQNPVFHSKTKHIEIRHHFIRDCYEKKLIQVIKIHTDHNVADLLTKAFDVSRFNFLIASIGLLNL
ncbi:putative ribonuclease H-like domain-containing protein [Tanacetum coccineum]